jgi:hypothetical protein
MEDSIGFFMESDTSLSQQPDVQVVGDAHQQRNGDVRPENDGALIHGNLSFCRNFLL